MFSDYFTTTGCYSSIYKTSLFCTLAFFVESVALKDFIFTLTEIWSNEMALDVGNLLYTNTQQQKQWKWFEEFKVEKNERKKETRESTNVFFTLHTIQTLNIFQALF